MISLRLQSALSTRTNFQTKAKIKLKRHMNNKEERHRLLYRFIKEVQSCFVLRRCYPLTDSLRILNLKYKCAQAKQVYFIYTLSGSNHSLLLLRYH